MPGLLFIVASVQLLGACACYAAARTPRRMPEAWLLALVGLIFTCLMTPYLVLSYLLLLAAGLICLWRQASVRTFFGWSAGGLVLLALYLGGSNVVGWQRLRHEYPIESMRARLPEPTAHLTQSGQSIPLRSDTLDRLEAFEQSHMLRSYRFEGNLRMIHASMVEQFASSPGFGVGRMMPPSPSHVAPRVAPAPLPQPVPAEYFEPHDSPGDEQPLPLAERMHGAIQDEKQEATSLETMHTSLLANFADPETLGYFRDRDFVVGFEPHAFHEKEDGYYSESWQSVRADQVARLELVSLLLHAEPGVYVSENLPNMQDVANLPVRPLDDFERQALRQLYAGNDLVVGEGADDGRMLGSLRAAQICADCHAVERGTLLGAFSYRLHRAGMPPRAQPTPKPAL